MNAIIAAILLLASTLIRVPDSQAEQSPKTGSPQLITAVDQPITSNPLGDQTLKLAAPIDAPATLDPAFVRDVGTTFIARQIFRGLTRLDDSLQPVPELADRIEVSADGLTYTVHVRENAAFQNGAKITAQDVVFSLTRAMNPETAGGDVSQLVGPTFLSGIEGANDLLSGQSSELAGVVALDEQTVEIRLAEPESTFLMKLASIPASIVDSDQVESDSNWRLAPNGSGPFRVAEWIEGERLLLEPSEHYYAGTPALTSIEFRLGRNASEPYNLYQRGQIDVAAIDLFSIDRILAPESGLSEQVVVTPQFALEFVAFRTDVAPMDDPHIRNAIQLGFERTKIPGVTFDGHVGQICGLIPNGMLGVDWPCESYPFDPEAAKEEISKSRYGSVEEVPPIEIYIGVTAAGRTMSDVLRDDLAQNVGLQVTVIAVDLPEFLSGLSKRDYPAFSVYWSADYPDPESLLWTLFSSESKDNYTDFRNQKFDDALERASNEQDLANRINDYAEAQQLLVDDAVILPLYNDVSYTLVKPFVKGLVVTPIGILGLERIWLER
jgi:oligopeptide transport system substrate-binding protein